MKMKLTTITNSNYCFKKNLYYSLLFEKKIYYFIVIIIRKFSTNGLYPKRIIFFFGANGRCPYTFLIYYIYHYLLSLAV